MPQLRRVESEQKSGRWFWRHRDLLAAAASGLVGALALATSTYNVYLQRQQVRAQVWPRLSLDTDWTADTVALQIQNRGVGPASVRRLRVWVDGARAGDWVSALAALFGRRERRLAALNEVENQVMSPGMLIAPIKVSGADALEFLAQRRRLALEICYCSTLEDCWLLSVPELDEPTATLPTGDCKPDPTPFRAISPKTMDETVLRQLRAAAPSDGGTADAGPAR